MSENFDPYYKWLGIAPTEQPPNHYRLLGLNLFESDLDVIESGSDRQMTHLRSFQTGPHMRECQKLLNEVAAARILLLDVQRKAAYDQLLQACLLPAEPPPNAPAVPLTPADTSPILESARAASPVVVAKRSRPRRKQAVSPPVLVAGGMIGLAVLLAIGFGMRKAIRPASRPVAQPLDLSSSPSVEYVEPDHPTGPQIGGTSTSAPSLAVSVSPSIAATDPLSPTNVLVDVRDEYQCTTRSQPQLAIDGSFDAARSWRLAMRVDASPQPEGTVLCWGDGRPGRDPICIKAGPDYVSGWVMDNTRSDGGTALPKMTIDWPTSSEIEIVYDAASKVLQLRVDEQRQNVPVPHPPQADRPMPLHLGGIGMGALHAFPCNIRDLRLEQLTDPVNLPAATAPAVAVATTKPAGSGDLTEKSEPTGSLGDLVKSREVSKLAVPADAELQAAREQIRHLFASDLGQERSPQESAALAEKLQNQAIQSGTQPAMRYAMLEVAVDVAARGGAVDSASKAIQELDRVFTVNLVQLKADAAKQIADVAKEAWEHKAVAELLEAVIDECLMADRYDLAMSLADAANDAARKSKDSFTVNRLVARSRDVKSLKVKYEPVRDALNLLAAEADDPAANDTVGQHLCLVKGNWEAGLPYLVKSGASDLRDVAARDIRKPTTPETQAAVGGDWLKVATRLEKRLQLQAYLRAEYWYRLALAGQSGLKRLPLEQHISDISKDVGKLAKLPSGAVLVMTFEPSTLKRQGVVLDVSQHGYFGVVHGAVLAEGIAGKSLAFNGTDTYVEVASTPWLSAPPAFTLAAWANIASWTAPNRDIDYVLSKEDSKARRAHGYVLRYRDGGNADFTIASSGWRNAVATKKVGLGEWHHIAATFDGQIAKVFLDGEMDGNAPVSGAIEPSSVPFRIGQSAFDKNRGIRGRVDEVAIFNRALSAEEVRTVYRIGLAGRPLTE